MDKVYKLRHKATGLFFKPVTETWNKSNLSKTGKIYERKTTFAKVTGKIYCGDHKVDGSFKTIRNANMIDSKPSDWEIVIYETVEKEVIQNG